ncbi:helicase-related protein [uncultured Brevundimonas sp.]|uniref:C-terminal helicase domain-containing protein n=1 Tax=uncultured Brevundimonas sp. TaxID=213418 RepID=UPI0025DBF9E6|nr:helicase-related protein [uncultured Brevundimonas sp.]
MAKLERFQEATALEALAALSSPKGSRRFLIADEVGLGKTVVSRFVAQGLKARAGRPLNVVYFCSSLTIAGQNLTKLKALQPGWEPPEDRLSLVCRDPRPSNGLDYRIFSFTPDTSLPGWKRSNRTGRAPERKLIADLMEAVSKPVSQKLHSMDRARLREAEGRRVNTLLPSGKAGEIDHLKPQFILALRDVFELRGRPLEAGLLAWLDRTDDLAEFILRARCALSLVALRHPDTRPDFLILDEFHRFADLIVPKDAPPKPGVETERRRVHQLLSAALLEAGVPTLLLSATPYRLTSVDGATIPGSRYEHLRRLVSFLNGGDAKASQVAAARIDAYHSALAAQDGDKAKAVEVLLARKAELEAALRPIMARTERATTLPGELFEKLTLPTEVTSPDLQVFRHFARAARVKALKLQAWVQPLWASVPYPAETLFDYGVARGFGGPLPPITTRNQKGGPAHPRLRSLLSARRPTPAEGAVNAPSLPPVVDTRILRLPWLPPSRPWWRLDGAWKGLEGQRSGKAILFSRYIGTPPSVSAVVSLAVRNAISTASQTAGQSGFLQLDKESPGPLVALFMPWPQLSRLNATPVQPAKPSSKIVRDHRAVVLQELSTRIKIGGKRDVTLKPWQIALGVERHLGGEADTKRLFQCHRSLATVYQSMAAKAPALRWITQSEAILLADWMLSAPGLVVARSVARHQAPATPGWWTSTKARKGLVEFCWDQLRTYFSHRQFADLLRGGARGRRKPKPYPDALRQAILDGGFEAVLDEQLAIMAVIGEGGPIDQLRDSLVSAGNVRMRRRAAPPRTEVHVAMPFNGAKRKASKKDSSGKESDHRSTAIRGAFNSPFWPHLLSTTSVGQEGLDFHVWCDRIIHWDLPRDPVDFEQREGRIARYGSLAVRRALTAEFATEDAGNARASPFGGVLNAARMAPKVGIGLDLWWSPPADKPRRITFDTAFSRSRAQLDALEDDLMRYRLGLGQPDPEQFGRFVEHFMLSGHDVRSLALDLSAVNRPKHASGTGRS